MYVFHCSNNPARPGDLKECFDVNLMTIHNDSVSFFSQYYMNDRVLQNIRCKRPKLPRRGPGQSPGRKHAVLVHIRRRWQNACG